MSLSAYCGPSITRPSTIAVHIFAALAKVCLEGMKTVFQTSEPVIIYPASGTGAWEAALVNTLNQGDKVLSSDTGQFAALWAKIWRATWAWP